MPMQNITTEHYKKAIKEKYEEVKNGDNSHFLQNPSQAKLRKLCWEIFQINKNSDDLKTFSTLFEFCFDISKKNTLQSKTDKFKSVGAFFRGKTESPTDEIVEFAAVLVGFEPRPFGKFKKYYGQKNREEENLMAEPKAVVEPELERSVINDVDRSQPNKNLNDDIGFIKNPESLNFVGSVKRKFFEKLFKKSKSTIIVTLVMFLLIGGVIYFAFIKEHCIQWSNDHYEIVDCSSGLVGNINVIIPYNKDLLDFKKIKVCDTTTCFKSDGQAIIWYAKTANGIDFFNTHGTHPENKKALRPVTQYIIDKYVKHKE